MIVCRRPKRKPPPPPMVQAERGLQRPNGAPAWVAVGETVILLALSLSPSLLKHLLKADGDAAE